MDGKYDAARMFYNRRIVPALIRRADHVITVSHFTADDLVNLVGYPREYAFQYFFLRQHGILPDRPTTAYAHRRQQRRIAHAL